MQQFARFRGCFDGFAATRKSFTFNLENAVTVQLTQPRSLSRNCSIVCVLLNLFATVYSFFKKDFTPHKHEVRLFYSSSSSSTHSFDVNSNNV